MSVCCIVPHDLDELTHRWEFVSLGQAAKENKVVE